MAAFFPPRSSGLSTGTGDADFSLGYFASVARAKTGLNDTSLALVSRSECEGPANTAGYSVISGGSGAIGVGTGAGVAKLTCPDGATSSSYCGITNPSQWPCMSAANSLKWFYVTRFRIPQAADANTRMFCGIQTGVGVGFLGFGVLGSHSTTAITSFAGNTSTPSVVGAHDSTIPIDTATMMWGYLWSDLISVYFSIAGEADQIVCPVSSLTAVSAYPEMLNFPASGTRSEDLWIDSFALWAQRS